MDSRIFCNERTWLEGPAVEQFRRVLALPGILRGAAFPDLHPGRGVPAHATDYHFNSRHYGLSVRPVQGFTK